MFAFRNFYKKKPTELVTCQDCGQDYPKKKIYKFSWRYNSKTTTYQSSGRAFIITGFRYVCKKCLREATKS